MVIKTSPSRLRDLMRSAREAGLDKLLTINVVDLPKTGRLLLIYTLTSVTSQALASCTVHVKVTVRRDSPHVPSVSDIYPEADYFERECYEMFGVIFNGNSECKGTFFLDKSLEGLYPLRKDRA